jgi:hypothetical protein
VLLKSHVAMADGVVVVIKNGDNHSAIAHHGDKSTDAQECT